ncbi:MAG: hypothetical protein JO250_11360 [Armatimonadetes bacterium]|nr:hypothetical protein [Armatimonadota bacterium]
MGAAGLLLAGLLLAGCHSARRPAPPVPVYADIAVLARRHPGWQSVALFDGMLGRLNAAIRQARAGGPAPAAALTLPAQTGLDLPGEVFTMPASALEQERRQLAGQQQAQLARLQARRERARQQQLDLQQAHWQREAQLRYAQAVQDAQARYRQRYEAAFNVRDVRRLNLFLQIKALEKIVAEWKLPKPTPVFDHANQELTDKRAELARLDAERTGLTGSLQAERDAALARAAADREAYVQTQRAQMAENLRSQDESILAAQRAQLARQTALLLSQERALAGGTVPAAGAVGALSLPPVAAARAAQPVRDLEAAARRLQGQRDRWIAFLYDDTQAAARDAARQRGWTVTFDSSHRGETDVTAPLAALLAGSVWKS